MCYSRYAAAQLPIYPGETQNLLLLLVRSVRSPLLKKTVDFQDVLFKHGFHIYIYNMCIYICIYNIYIYMSMVFGEKSTETHGLFPMFFLQQATLVRDKKTQRPRGMAFVSLVPREAW